MSFLLLMLSHSRANNVFFFFAVTAISLLSGSVNITGVFAQYAQGEKSWEKSNKSSGEFEKSRGKNNKSRDQHAKSRTF